MAKRAPRDEDPQVTDLRRYRKAREAAARKAKSARPPGAPLLGSNPRAGLILAALLILMLAIYVLPRFLK